MTFLVLPIGPPGCGKSTLAAYLMIAGCFDADAVVSPDGLRDLMTGDRANQNFNGAVFSVANDIAGTRLQCGLPVFFDATNLTNNEYLENKARSNGVDLIYAYFEVDGVTCRERNQSRQHVVPDHAMDRMMERYRQFNKFNPYGVKYVIKDGEPPDSLVRRLLNAQVSAT